jgi:hypothetical protein
VVALVVACAIAVRSIVVGRALTAKSAQVTVEPSAQIVVDDGAIARLAGAIGIPTISRDDGPGCDFGKARSGEKISTTKNTKLHEKIKHTNVIVLFTFLYLNSFV